MLTRRITESSGCVALVATLALVAGCGSPGRPNASAPPTPAKTIYVANGCNGTVTAYPVGSNGNVAPIVPNPGLCAPSNIAVNKTNGDIYVANFLNGTITAYAKGSSGSVAAKVSLSNLFQGPQIAFDATGRLYASAGAIIQVYAPGANGDAQPIATISGSSTGLDYVSFLAVDPNGTVAVSVSDGVLIFAAGASGNIAPIQTIPNLSGPNLSGSFLRGLAFDDSGNLYVGYWSQGNPPSIVVYGKSAQGFAPTATIINTKSNYLRNIGLDSSGKIYAYDEANVFVFGPGSNGAVNPIATISIPPATAGNGFLVLPSMAVDADGTIVITDSGVNRILSFAPGASGPTPTSIIAATATGISRPSGIAIGSDGDIYLAGQMSSSATYPEAIISRFAASTFANAAPIATVGDGIQGDYSRGLALDSAGNQYITAILGGTGTGGAPPPEAILGFAAGSNGVPTMPFRSIAGPDTGMGSPNSPTRITSDHNDNLYVSYYDSDNSTGGILKFAAGSNGDSLPIATITGPNTNLTYPEGIAIDAGGDIYVADQQSGIEIFASDANGDVAPKAVISGKNTQLFLPFAVAVDDAGSIFVVNGGIVYSNFDLGLISGTSILEFAAGSNGNVAPIAVIRGSATAIADASAIAVAP